LEIRSLEEQQAALNLAQLSEQGTANITTLIDALLVRQPPPFFFSF
jgi:hypothetical protein